MGTEGIVGSSGSYHVDTLRFEVFVAVAVEDGLTEGRGDET